MPFKQQRAHETKALTSSTQTTLQIPTGGKLQSVALYFTTGAGAAATEADVRGEIDTIQLTINGRDIVNTDAASLYDLYEGLGVKVGSNAGIAGAVELNIGRLVMQNTQLADAYGFGTADVSSIQVRVTSGTLTNIANVQAFTTREAVNQNLGQHCRFIKYPRNFNTTGDDTFDTLPRDIDSAYLAVLMSDGASGAISNGELRMNGAILKEKTPTNVNNLDLSNNKLAGVSGYYIYSFVDGTPSGSVPMLGVNDLRFITTFSTAPGAAGYAAYALTINGIPAAAQ